MTAVKENKSLKTPCGRNIFGALDVKKHAQLDPQLNPDQQPLPLASIGMPRLTRGRNLDRRAVPEECPIALVDHTTAAVVMATPADLTDVAIGRRCRGVQPRASLYILET
jgi:hypothetical protein